MGLEQPAHGATICLTCNREFESAQALCPFDLTLLAPLQPDPLVGKLLKENYEILAPAGEGATSMVYKARHNLMLRTVALKILKRSGEEDSRGAKRLRREALALSLVDHGNIIFLYDCGHSDNGRPFLVLEYLKGEALSSLIRQRGALPVNRFIQIFVQVCDALGHAHRRGVIHRDLKPDNILICKSDTGEDMVKLVDFGIAKFADAAPIAAQELNGDEVCGSMPYFSPEQSTPSKMDARSDIYSLGIVMYESLVGALPFTAESLIGWLKAHRLQPPPSFHDVRPDLRISPRLETAVQRCLLKEPGERFQCMQELQSELLAAVSS